MPLYLAIKEILRNKGRFLAICMIIGLITLLVLFIAGLGDGLALEGKEYIENMDADLILFQENSEFSIVASRLDRSKLNDIMRIEGVESVGPLGFSRASLVLDDDGASDKIDVSLVGVEPGMPGTPDVVEGMEFRSRRANEIILDQHVLDQAKIPLGAIINLEVLKGTQEEIYPLKVVGYTEGQKYSFSPSVFVPLLIWNKIKPQANSGSNGDLEFNITAIKLQDPDVWPEMIMAIERRIDGIEVTDLVTTYEATPGFTAQQTTLNTQQQFTLLIALLVMGGFFQIQTLQKMGQIGMLKAIGASNWLISATLIMQVIVTTIIGVAIGGLTVWFLTSILPPNIPVTFEGQKVVTAVLTLLAIGPIAGLVSIRTLLRVEPLKALGLGS